VRINFAGIIRNVYANGKKIAEGSSPGPTSFTSIMSYNYAVFRPGEAVLFTIFGYDFKINGWSFQNC
jgi:hypothetical protein